MVPPVVLKPNIQVFALVQAKTVILAILNTFVNVTKPYVILANARCYVVLVCSQPQLPNCGQFFVQEMLQVRS